MSVGCVVAWCWHYVAWILVNWFKRSKGGHTAHSTQHTAC